VLSPIWKSSIAADDGMMQHSPHTTIFDNQQILIKVTLEKDPRYSQSVEGIISSKERVAGWENLDIQK